MSDPASHVTSTDLATLTQRSKLPVELQNASGLKKLDWVLSLDDPRAFVAGLAPQELHYWLRDIGKEDAYPLLEYAEPEQLRALVDIDTWTRHELSIPRFLEWFDLALAVDLETAQRFILAQDDELLMWLVTGELQVLPADADIDLIPDELAFFSSPDGLYTVTVPRDHPLEERIPQLMRLLWDADMDRARELFQQAQFELHESVNEDMERFRNARLQDLGYEPPTEALEVFSVVPLQTLKQALRDAPSLAANLGPAIGSASGMVTDLILKDVRPPDLLRDAISTLDERNRKLYGDGFAYLANKVFMAEIGDLSRLDDLPQAAHYAVGLANLGLSYLAMESEDLAARIVTQVTPETLFKAGWTLVTAVAKKARRLAHRAGVDRGFALFGSPTDETISAAATLRPVFPELLEGGAALGYRPVRTLADLSLLEARVDQATAELDAFEHRFGLTIDALEAADLPGIGPDARRRIRLTTLVRTGLLHLLLSDEFRFAPVDRDSLVAFSRAAFAEGGLSATFMRLVKSVSAPALEPTDASTNAESFAVSRLLERAMDELVESLGNVAERDLDLRYAGELFLASTV